MNPRNTPHDHGPAMSLGECQVALALARAELAELRDKYVQTASEMETVRRRAERDAATLITQRLRSFSVQLLEVVDNLERALHHAPPGDALRPGVQATLQQFLTVLRQEGVVPIPVEIGARFDPQIHEAIGGHEADVTHETVAEVTQVGYTFDGQVLRPARVVVALPSRSL